jgi:hypothetical protein
MFTMMDSVLAAPNASHLAGQGGMLTNMEGSSFSSMSTRITYPVEERPPSQLTSINSSNIDFYATLVSAVALHFWTKQPFPMTPSQCAAYHDLPLTNLLKHLFSTTKLPLEQFYLALKLIQVLTASYPELSQVSKTGSEIRYLNPLHISIIPSIPLLTLKPSSMLNGTE